MGHKFISFLLNVSPLKHIRMQAIKNLLISIWQATVTIHLFLPIVKKVQFSAKPCISQKLCEVKFHRGHDGSWFLVINLWGQQGWHMVQHDMKALVSWLHFFGVEQIKPGCWVLFHWTPIMGSRNCPFNSLWEGSPDTVHNSTIVGLQTALNSLTAQGRRGKRLALLIAAQNKEGENSWELILIFKVFCIKELCYKNQTEMA